MYCVKNQHFYHKIGLSKSRFPFLHTISAQIAAQSRSICPWTKFPDFVHCAASIKLDEFHNVVNRSRTFFLFGQGRVFTVRYCISKVFDFYLNSASIYNFTVYITYLYIIYKYIIFKVKSIS